MFAVPSGYRMKFNVRGFDKIRARNLIPSANFFLFIFIYILFIFFLYKFRVSINFHHWQKPLLKTPVIGDLQFWKWTPRCIRNLRVCSRVAKKYLAMNAPHTRFSTDMRLLETASESDQARDNVRSGRTRALSSIHRSRSLGRVRSGRAFVLIKRGVWRTGTYRFR